MSRSRTLRRISSSRFCGREPGCAKSSTLSRKTISVGMLRMLNAADSSCSSSVLIFAKATSGFASATFSYTGANARQGPHQGAHQSMNRMPPFSTVCWKASFPMLCTPMYASALFGRETSFFRRPSATGQVLGLHPRRIHPAVALGHRLLKLAELGCRSLDEAERIDLRHHDRLHVRGGESAGLTLL